MSRHFLLLLALIIAMPLASQELNRTDANGLKQGPWKKYFESKKDQLFYEGQFLDDVRVGQWIYYHKSGGKKAVMRLSDKGQVSRVGIFSEQGRLIGEGKYVGEKKDSTWVYYNDQGQIATLENWKEGLKHGLEETRFDSGDPVERLMYDKGMRSGPFSEYYEGNKVKREGSYLADEYEGPMTYYYPNGRKETTGKYVNGMREGTWLYYNENGSLHYQVVYRQGTAVKEKKENGVFREFAPDNAILSEITYKDGLKDGPFSFFHEVGEKVMKDFTDELTGEVYTKEVTIGNEPKMKGNYRLDKLHGKVEYYNEIGKLIDTEQYIDGEIQ